MACHSNSTHFLQRLILAGSLLFVSALTQAADDAIERERLAALLCEDKRMTDDNLVTFLPHRLNRQPVVVRGLTADELWICTGISAVAGLLFCTGSHDAVCQFSCYWIVLRALKSKI